ncbi:MAG: phosphoglycerate kinase, partial [Candidatus Levyibacteriota bacterium]
MILPDIKLANIEGKRVFLRSDLNVPLSENLKIEDDTRLSATLPTVKYLLSKASKVIIASHLGRPKGKDSDLSLLPISNWLRKQLAGDVSDLAVQNINGFDGWEITPKLFLLENLRFDSGEEDNSDDFAKKLASLADIYVNDAFGVAHRENASVVGIANFLPHFAGFLLQKEIGILSS